MKNYNPGLFTSKKPYRATIKFEFFEKERKQKLRKKKINNIINGISYN